MGNAPCNRPVHLKRLPQVGYCPCVLDKGHVHDPAVLEARQRIRPPAGGTVTWQPVT